MRKLGASEERVQLFSGLKELYRADYEEALWHFAQTCTHDPASVPARSLMVYTKLAAGDASEAFEIAETIDESEAVEFEDKLFLGYAAAMTWDLEKALRLLDEANETRPDIPRVLLARGIALTNLAISRIDLDEAKQWIDLGWADLDFAATSMHDSAAAIYNLTRARLARTTIYRLLAESQPEQQMSHLNEARRSLDDVRRSVPSLLSQQHKGPVQGALVLLRAYENDDETLRAIAHTWLDEPSIDVWPYGAEILAIELIRMGYFDDAVKILNRRRGGEADIGGLEFFARLMDGNRRESFLRSA